jgi:cytochrome c oxidase subunit 2
MLGLVHWLMIILLFIWSPFFIYTLIRFRKSRNPRANYYGTKSRLSSYLEVGVVASEAVLLLGFAFPIWSSLKNEFPSEKNTVVVHVVAEQFAWNIHYPGPDGIFGKRDINLVDPETNPLGLDISDPNSKDDLTTINELHLPVGKSAIIHLSSKDVIHSFGLPVMRIKQDIIPGMSIPVWFKPTRTGEFEIACAQLCGLGHYRMRGYLTIHTPEDYDEWFRTTVEEQEIYGF